VGFGTAAGIALKEAPSEQPRFRALRDRLEKGLKERLDGVEVNGHPEQRLAHTTNLSFAGIDADALMKAVPDVAVSSSSACTSALMQPSYVLGAMGCDEERIKGSLRFSLGRFTTEAEIDEAVAALSREARRLRK
jgi:cysteine desulfurase